MYKIIITYLLCISLVYGAMPTSYSGQRNPCDEGQFLDVGENQCKRLDKPNMGFDETVFLAAVDTSYIVTLSSCTESAFVTAMASIRNNNGGIVNIPACTITFSNEINIPNNILIQGKGVGKTIFTHTTGFSKSRVLSTLATSSAPKNIAIRDIELKGYSYQSNQIPPPYVFMSLIDVDNLLIERVEARNANKSMFSLDHSQRVTARYLYLHDNGQHGIGTKDCYPPSGTSGPAGSFGSSDCDNSTRNTGSDPKYWSSNLLVYSLYSHNNGGGGTDFHSSNLELAGIVAMSSTYSAGKYPELAVNVWVHDNVLSNNGSQGPYPKTQYCEVLDTTMQSKNFYIYRNKIQNNAKEGYRSDFVLNQYVKDNIFTGNGDNNTWSTGSSCSYGTVLPTSTVKVCPGGGINAGNYSGGKGSVTYLQSNDPACDLSTVGDIF